MMPFGDPVALYLEQNMCFVSGQFIGYVLAVLSKVCNDKNIQLFAETSVDLLGIYQVTSNNNALYEDGMSV
jgi:hypothetical protein